MTNVVPVDEFISDSWYPGYTPARNDAGVYTEALSTFRKEDEQRFWLLDFHYPRGMVPLGYVFPEDGICFCTQQAAEQLPLPTSGGLAVRMARPHIYTSEVPVTSPWAIGERVERIQQTLPDILGRFEQTWADRIGELNRGLAYFEGQSYDRRDIRDLARLYEEAVTFHRRAWTIHFEIMYPLLATYVGFHGEAYEDLCVRRREVRLPVAVRSSSSTEDAVAASSAGQYDTYLGLAGTAAVLDGVRRCWGSLFGARAMGYRMRHDLSHVDSPMAVGVVELVQARASGVAFSVNPVTGRRDRLVVEATFGYGEALVQGLVNPDHVEIGRTDRRVLSLQGR